MKGCTYYLIGRVMSAPIGMIGRVIIGMTALIGLIGRVIYT